MHTMAVSIIAWYSSNALTLYPGVFQQTISGLSVTNQDCYELAQACYSVYGFEYKPG
jgi:hypothetical protein